jgi:hypothetical protein
MSRSVSVPAFVVPPPAGSSAMGMGSEEKRPLSFAAAGSSPSAAAVASRGLSLDSKEQVPPLPLDKAKRRHRSQLPPEVHMRNVYPW